MTGPQSARPKLRVTTSVTRETGDRCTWYTFTFVLQRGRRDWHRRGLICTPVHPYTYPSSPLDPSTRDPRGLTRSPSDDDVSASSPTPAHLPRQTPTPPRRPGRHSPRFNRVDDRPDPGRVRPTLKTTTGPTDSARRRVGVDDGRENFESGPGRWGGRVGDKETGPGCKESTVSSVKTLPVRRTRGRRVSGTSGREPPVRGSSVEEGDQSSPVGRNKVSEEDGNLRIDLPSHTRPYPCPDDRVEGRGGNPRDSGESDSRTSRDSPLRKHEV